MRKTGRCILFEEGPLTGGVGAEVAARLAEHAFSSLKAPVIRVAAQDTPLPASGALERAVTPSLQSILDATDRLFA